MDIKSHLPSLDHNTQGFRKAEVAVLAGSPGSGKSAFALNQILTAINGSKVKTSLINNENKNRSINLDLLDTYTKQRNFTLLDAGCGNGTNLEDIILKISQFFLLFF